jgi:hypothetical protein
VQLPLAGIVPPEKVNVVAPADGAKVAPEQVVPNPGVAATCTPAGNGSVKEVPVSGMLLEFDKVNVKVEIPPVGIVAGEKALVIVGF